MYIFFFQLYLGLYGTSKCIGSIKHLKDYQWRCDIFQEPWKEMHMQEPRTSVHFRNSSFSLCCFLRETFLSATNQILRPSMSVRLPVLHASTICQSMNSIAIEAQISARGLVHTAQPRPWSSGLWRGLMSFQTRSPDQRGKQWWLKRLHVSACEQVKNGQEQEAPWKPCQHTCTFQFPDTRENRGGGVVQSTEAFQLRNRWSLSVFGRHTVPLSLSSETLMNRSMADVSQTYIYDFFWT